MDMNKTFCVSSPELPHTDDCAVRCVGGGERKSEAYMGERGYGCKGIETTASERSSGDAVGSSPRK